MSLNTLTECTACPVWQVALDPDRPLFKQRPEICYRLGEVSMLELTEGFSGVQTMRTFAVFHALLELGSKDFTASDIFDQLIKQGLENTKALRISSMRIVNLLIRNGFLTTNEKANTATSYRLVCSTMDVPPNIIGPDEPRPQPSDPADIQMLMQEFIDNEPDWQKSALCAQADPEAFFPEQGGSTREAKLICNECEVRSDCLEYALENNERFGIWGGLSERERRNLKEQTAKPEKS